MLLFYKNGTLILRCCCCCCCCDSLDRLYWKQFKRIANFFWLLLLFLRTTLLIDCHLFWMTNDHFFDFIISNNWISFRGLISSFFGHGTLPPFQYLSIYYSSVKILSLSHSLWCFWSTTQLQSLAVLIVYWTFILHAYSIYISVYLDCWSFSPIFRP